MKIALTGSKGLLGADLASHFELNGHQIVAINRATDPVWHPKAMTELLSSCDVLIHSAANTNVEACEQQIHECYRDNWALTESLAQAAAITKVPLVFVSSTGVYGTARDTPYCEFHEAAPTTHHHRSKLLAEGTVTRMSAENLVIRTGWLFGGASTNPKNFVANRIREARRCTTGFISANQSQLGNPTYSTDVAAAIDRLLNQGQCGVFNCVNAEAASRYDYVREILALAVPDVEVRRVEGAYFNRTAKVSHNESAQNWRMTNCAMPAMRGWKNALKEYIERLLPEMDQLTEL